jgi:hypothetical protein
VALLPEADPEIIFLLMQFNFLSSHTNAEFSPASKQSYVLSQKKALFFAVLFHANCL